MAVTLFGFPMVLDKIAAILFKMECHWKTEQRATIVFQLLQAWVQLGQHVKKQYSSPHCSLLFRSPMYLKFQKSLSPVSVSDSVIGGGSASLRSYFPSLPILYEFVEPLSHWTRIQPSSPSSPITRPSDGAGPSWRNGR